MSASSVSKRAVLPRASDKFGERSRRSRWVFAMGIVSAVVLGCIPSHRMVHDGDVYFERCYAADFDARVPPEKKEACWQAWLSFYTRHQPAHRVDYALRRIEAVQNGEPTPELPGSSAVAVTAVPQDVKSELTTMIAPDASAFAGRANPRLLASVIEGDAGPVPNGCLHYCNQYQAECSARCNGSNHPCEKGCESERKICLNGCY